MEPVRNKKATEDVFMPDKNHKYRQDLLLLKGRTITFFDQLMAFDLNFEEDRHEAIVISKGLQKKLEIFFKKYLGEVPKEKEELTKDQHRELQNKELTLKGHSQQEEKQVNTLEELKLAVEKVEDCTQENIIGGEETHLAMKNQNSFLVATSRRGIKVVEGGSTVFSRRVSKSDYLVDAIYIPHHNFYLFASADDLFRKDIDSKPPYLFMDARCDSGLRSGISFKYSNLHQRLIICKETKIILVINPLSREVEIEVTATKGSYTRDFRLFGKKQENVVSVFSDGYIIVYGLKYSQKTGSVIAYSQIKLDQERKESPQSVSVCDKDQYILVEIGQKNNYAVSSRMLVFKINSGYLTKTASIDLFSQQIGQKYPLESFGYRENHILWVGLSDWKTYAQVYDYDVKLGELKELESLRECHKEKRPMKLHSLDGKLYYIGYRGQLMRLSLGNWAKLI